MALGPRPAITVGVTAADRGVAHRPRSDVTIGRLRIDDGHATIADAALGGTAEITGVGLTGRDVTWPARGTAPVDLTATVAGGRLTARGTVDGAQRRGEIALTLRGADLATLQSWLPINGRVAGAADADLTAIVGLEPFSLVRARQRRHQQPRLPRRHPAAAHGGARGDDRHRPAVARRAWPSTGCA